MEQMKERPSYVIFETRPVEDRTASLEAGHYVAKDQVFAVITPAGSKDRTDREAESWLKSLAQLVEEGRFPQEWLDSYHAKYEAYKRGQEIPENGYSIRNWPLLSPGQLDTLIKLHVLTVEDLATANEQTLNRIGMGSRALKEKAIAFLAAPTAGGKLAEQQAALTVANQQLQETVNAQQVKMTELSAALAALQAKAA